MRSISVNELRLINEIARMHEAICVQFKENYQTDEIELSLRTESIRLLLNYKDEIFVMDDDGLKGFIWISHKQHHFYIKSTYVHPDYRRRGIAVLMKQYLHEYAVQMNKKYILTKVTDNNHPMLKLNQKLGYIHDGQYMKKYLEVKK